MNKYIVLCEITTTHEYEVEAGSIVEAKNTAFDMAEIDFPEAEKINAYEVYNYYE